MSLCANACSPFPLSQIIIRDCFQPPQTAHHDSDGGKCCALSTCKIVRYQYQTIPCFLCHSSAHFVLSLFCIYTVRLFSLISPHISPAVVTVVRECVSGDEKAADRQLPHTYHKALTGHFKHFSFSRSLSK